MTKLRKKIATNGFTQRELLGMRRIYKELKKVYHPDMTRELTLEDAIKEETRKSFTLMKYYILIIVLSSLTALFFRRADFLFMPALFVIIALHDAYSTARSGQRKIISELKLMKLAIRMWF